MSYIYYKFKSNIEYDAIKFDGLNMSLEELRDRIMDQKKMNKTGSYTLQIINAQTKEEYKEDVSFIPKNTSVIVARIPVVLSKKSNDKKSKMLMAESVLVNHNNTFYHDYNTITNNSNLSTLEMPEDQKVKAMINQATKDFDPALYQNLKYRYPPPATYVCYKCHQGGHWIQFCPIVPDNNFENRIKRSTGIPKSFLTTVQGPKIKGALLTNDGKFAVPIIDQKAYIHKKIELPPFLPQHLIENHEIALKISSLVPKALQCGICHFLYNDPVDMPCCGSSFCQKCITASLLEHRERICPNCHECDIEPKSLKPSITLKANVSKFIESNLNKNMINTSSVKLTPTFNPSFNNDTSLSRIQSDPTGERDYNYATNPSEYLASASHHHHHPYPQLLRPNEAVNPGGSSTRPSFYIPPPGLMAARPPPLNFAHMYNPYMFAPPPIPHLMATPHPDHYPYTADYKGNSGTGGPTLLTTTGVGSSTTVINNTSSSLDCVTLSNNHPSSVKLSSGFDIKNISKSPTPTTCTVGKTRGPPSPDHEDKADPPNKIARIDSPPSLSRQSSQEKETHTRSLRNSDDDSPSTIICRTSRHHPSRLEHGSADERRKDGATRNQQNRRSPTTPATIGDETKMTLRRRRRGSADFINNSPDDNHSSSFRDGGGVFERENYRRLLPHHGPFHYPESHHQRFPPPLPSPYHRRRYHSPTPPPPAYRDHAHPNRPGVPYYDNSRYYPNRYNYSYGSDVPRNSGRRSISPQIITTTTLLQSPPRLDGGGGGSGMYDVDRKRFLNEEHEISKRLYRQPRRLYKKMYEFDEMPHSHPDDYPPAPFHLDDAYHHAMPRSSDHLSYSPPRKRSVLRNALFPHEDDASWERSYLSSRQPSSHFDRSRVLLRRVLGRSRSPYFRNSLTTTSKGGTTTVRRPFGHRPESDDAPYISTSFYNNVLVPAMAAAYSRKPISTVAGDHSSQSIRTLRSASRERGVVAVEEDNGPSSDDEQEQQHTASPNSNIIPPSTSPSCLSSLNKRVPLLPTPNNNPNYSSTKFPPSSSHNSRPTLTPFKGKGKTTLLPKTSNYYHYDDEDTNNFLTKTTGSTSSRLNYENDESSTSMLYYSGRRKRPLLNVVDYYDGGNGPPAPSLKLNVLAPGRKNDFPKLLVAAASGGEGNHRKIIVEKSTNGLKISVESSKFFKGSGSDNHYSIPPTTAAATERRIVSLNPIMPFPLVDDSKKSPVSSNPTNLANDVLFNKDNDHHPSVDINKPQRQIQNSGSDDRLSQQQLHNTTHLNSGMGELSVKSMKRTIKYVYELTYVYYDSIFLRDVINPEEVNNEKLPSPLHDETCLPLTGHTTTKAAILDMDVPLDSFKEEEGDRFEEIKRSKIPSPTDRSARKQQHSYNDDESISNNSANKTTTTTLPVASLEVHHHHSIGSVLETGETPPRDNSCYPRHHNHHHHRSTNKKMKVHKKDGKKTKKIHKKKKKEDKRKDDGDSGDDRKKKRRRKKEKRKKGGVNDRSKERGGEDDSSDGWKKDEKLKDSPAATSSSMTRSKRKMDKMKKSDRLKGHRPRNESLSVLTSPNNNYDIASDDVKGSTHTKYKKKGTKSKKKKKSKYRERER